MTGLKGREEMYLARYLRTADTPWYRQLMHYNPADYVPRDDVPVLALNGDCDIMVPSGPNLAMVDSLLRKGGNKHYEIVSLPGLNHMFQPAVTGSPVEYSDIEETIAPAVLQEIVNWLNQLK